MSNLILAIDAWRRIVGSDRVVSDIAALGRWQANITVFDRQIDAVVRPAGRAQLPEIVRTAVEFGQTLYPVSCGKNWGQGSALPPSAHATLLLLDDLDAIVEVDERLRYAVIEPGVTQGQLASYLERNHPSVIFNMTGSGTGTSVLGNILERGAAMYGQRINALRSVEACLADGSFVRTGLWHFGDRGVHHYRHGLGPDLTGLFVQSNLGIVSTAVVGLLPRQESELLAINCNRTQLAPLADKLFVLREAGVLSAGPVFVNQADHRVTAGDVSASCDEPWAVFTSLNGSRRMRQAKLAEFEEALQGLAVPFARFGDPDGSPTPSTPFVHTMLDLLGGAPSNFSLEMFRQFLSRTPSTGIAGSEVEYDLDRDRGAPGMSCVLPAVPFEGSKVEDVVRIVQAHSRGLPLAIGFTFVAHDATTLEGFIRVIFDRSNPEHVAAARAWSISLYTLLKENDVFPYRLHIDAMNLFIDDEDDTFWRTVSRIKRALDPNSILAPGRYSSGL